MSEINTNSMTEEQIREIAHQIVDRLGPTLVAGLSGAKDRTAPLRWAGGTGVDQPDTMQVLRLHKALEVFKKIEDVEGANIARIWFLGANPWLNEDSAVTAIRENRFIEVGIAAKAFIEDSTGF